MEQFPVHSFMGSAPCECTNQKLNFGHWTWLGLRDAIFPTLNWKNMHNFQAKC